MQMNWRVLTAINAAIALVTLSAVIYVANRPRAERRHASARANQTKEQEQASEREAKARIEALADLSQARVDDLGAVPAAELTHLMDRATPEQLAVLASKFNDAPTDARTFGGMAVFFQAWAQLDPNAALIGAFGINDVGMRKLAATTVVYSVSPSAAPELIAYVTEHPDKDLSFECKNGFLGTLISNWSLLNPEAASKFIDSLGNTKSNFGYKAREDIAYNWATLDPSAALEWISKQKDKDYVDANDLYDGAIRGWCRKDLSAAAAYVAQHLDDPVAGQLASSVATAMFDHQIEEATDWVRQMPAGAPRNEAESTVASMWSAKDPASAAKWLATLPESEQTNVVRVIASDWVNTNWPDASRWLGTLTGDVRDEALTVALNREDSTPVESLSLALWIKNDDKRNESIETVIRNWAATDAQTAETWVKGSSLSNEQQAKLLSVISDTQNAATEATAERVIIEH